MSDFNLLIVEDDADDLRAIKRLLEKDASRHYLFEDCGSLGAALDLMESRTFDAVLLDLGLPDSKGLETLTSLQEHNIDTPIVILTELDDENFAEQAMRLGFEDYVPKSALLTARLDWQVKQAVERHKVTKGYYERATVDALTGVHNRAYFDEALQRAVSEHNRSGENMALALIDLDDFKTVNDQQGHAMGDIALIALGESLNACKRSEDIAARIGGDEFALLLGHTKEGSGPEQLLERIKTSFAENARKQGMQVVPTLSIGVVWHQPEMTAKQLYAHADQAMYQVKNNGKDGFSFANAR